MFLYQYANEIFGRVTMIIFAASGDKIIILSILCLCLCVWWELKKCYYILSDELWKANDLWLSWFSNCVSMCRIYVIVPRNCWENSCFYEYIREIVCLYDYYLLHSFCCHCLRYFGYDGRYQLPIALFGLISCLALWDVLKLSSDRWRVDKYPVLRQTLIRIAQCCELLLIWRFHLQLLYFVLLCVEVEHLSCLIWDWASTTSTPVFKIIESNAFLDVTYASSLSEILHFSSLN